MPKGYLPDGELPYTTFARVHGAMRQKEQPHPYAPGDYGCKFPGGCDLREDQHTFEYILVIELKRDCTGTELMSWLNSVKNGWGRDCGFTGFSLMASKYQVLAG